MNPLPRTQQRVILLKAFRNYPQYADVILYKSDSVHLLRGGEAVLPEYPIMIFPLVDFCFNENGISKSFFQYEKVEVPAWVASHILSGKPCIVDNSSHQITASMDPCAEIYRAEIHQELEHEIENPQVDACEENPKEYFHYIATMKGGHVGKYRYYPIHLPIIAQSEEDAIAQAIQLPRVKHKSINDLLDIIKVDHGSFIKQSEENRVNPYFLSTNSYEAKSWKKDHINDFLKEEEE